ncbi:hypothetical protein [Xylophilus sp. GOD-11R]|uniref:hypothetical protein n=1 Tax=Xylophilus sp. GOD-11R TaxID=3089814 RepID=UPI00298D3C31|nr:hypothetical protein [Xylophilus sp. GOD-11R]WPB56890.1 hypothetical protein R9X41_22605 [Xylophilus sp. GOD-11R]
MFPSSISNNVTHLANHAPTGQPATVILPPSGPENPGLQRADHRLENLPGFDNDTAISTGGFGPPPHRDTLPRPYVFDVRVQNRTVTDWIAAYADLLWTRPADNTSSSEGVRQTVIDALGGRKSSQGLQASRQFSEVYRYLDGMARARDWYVARFPSHADLIRDGANYLRSLAVDRLARGLHESDPAANLRAHIEPRIATAQREVDAALARERVDNERRQEADRVRQQKQQQIKEIQAFWRGALDFSYDWLRYILFGEKFFTSIEDMERNCPPGDYKTVYDPLVDREMATSEFVYQGGYMRKAYLFMPDGSDRLVSFYGPYWIYAEVDPRSRGIPADMAVVAEQDRHVNVHWNDDPAVINARIEGSSTNRVD